MSINKNESYVFSEWTNETKSFIRADSNMITKMSSACNSSICIRLGTDHLTCGGTMVFYFRSENCFRTTRELEYLFFPPVFNIRLYDKNSESDYFFFLHQNQNIFSATLGIRICFCKVKHKNVWYHGTNQNGIIFPCIYNV